MAAVIDLTVSDDEPPSRNGRPRPASTFRANSARRSTSNVSRSPVPARPAGLTQRPRHSSSQRRPIFSPPRKDQAANSRSSLNGNAQHISRASASQSQSSQQECITSRAADESFKSSTQNSEPPIAIDSDSEREQPKRRPPRDFVMPRGVEVNGTSQASNQPSSLLDSSKQYVETNRKRHLERGNSLGNDSPSKRPRLGNREAVSTSSSQNNQSGSARSRQEGVSQPVVISPPRPRISNVHETFDLTSKVDSPVRLIEQRALQNCQGQRSASSKRSDRPSLSANAREPSTSTPYGWTNGRASAPETEPQRQGLYNGRSDQRAGSSLRSVAQSDHSHAPNANGSRTPDQRLVRPVNRECSPRTSVTKPMRSTTADSPSSTRNPDWDDPALLEPSKDSGMPRHSTNASTLDKRDVDPISRDPGSQQKRTTEVAQHRSSGAHTRGNKGKYQEVPQAACTNRKEEAARAESEASRHREVQEPSTTESAKSLCTVDHAPSNTSPLQPLRRESQTNGGRALEKEQADFALLAKGPSKRTERHSATPKAQADAVLPHASTSENFSSEKADDSPGPRVGRSSHLDQSDDVVCQAERAPQPKKKPLRSHKGRKQAVEVSSPQRRGVGAGSTNVEASKTNSNLEAPLADVITAESTLSDAEKADFQLQSEAMQSIESVERTDDTTLSFANPTAPGSVSQMSAMYSALSLTNRVEKVLGKYLEQLRGDNEYWTSVSLRRARLTKDVDKGEDAVTQSKEAPHEVASFAYLKPLDFSQHTKASSLKHADSEIWHTQRMARDAKPMALVERAPSYVKFATDQADVPNYAHYVSIKNNILAPNVIHLHCWPYFGDDFDMQDAENLPVHYYVDIIERERKLLLLQKAQKYEPYAESALRDIECSWSDVLRYLLEEAPDVGSDSGAQKALQIREQVCAEDFTREDDRWKRVLHSLPPSTPEKLSRVAVLCENFQKMAKFSIWHIARRSPLTEPLEAGKGATAAHPADNQLTCRMCLRFNCPYHGHFRHRADNEGSDSDADSVSSVDTVVATDVVHPPKANYRSRLAFPADLSDGPKPMEITLAKRKGQKNPDYWANYTHKPEERGPFYPCNHPGQPCKAANCRCVQRDIPCEKICSCSSDCPNKFRGCSCALKKGHKIACFEDPDCACWQLGRECDPDLCGACGVCDVLDPVHKFNDAVLNGRCRNASIQRGRPKHTLLGDSAVHGLGLYACEYIRAHEFVGEYKGEVINKREADRRGAVYEHQKLSYLFSLNKAQEIDSTYFGNKMRFINHAHSGKANLYPRIIAVNTIHRIGLYAERDIPVGKELLFDYGPYFPDEQLQGKKSKKTAPESKKSAPHVRNALLVKGFYDVEESEDEDGTLRAKAVASATTRPRKGVARVKKPGGGARAGAGRKPQPAQNVHDARPATPPPLTEPPKSSRGPNAAERLSAYNISDDTYSIAMDVDADAGAEDDDVFESPEASGTDDSELSANDRTSEFEEEDDELGIGRFRRRRGGVETRRYHRR